MTKDDFRKMKQQFTPSEKTINELYEKIEQEKQKPKFKKYRKFIKYGSIAACFVFLLAGVGIAVSMSRDNIQNSAVVSQPSKNFTTGASSTTENDFDDEVSQEINKVVDGQGTTNQQEIYEESVGQIKDEDVYLGAEFEFNGNNYVIAKKASGYLYGTNLSLKEDYPLIQIKSTDSNESIYTDVYEWGNISPEAAVAIGKQYTGELDVEMLDPCYICINKAYSPEKLGDIINDFNINNNVVFCNIEYTDYDGMTASHSPYNVSSTDEELYNMLFADLSESKVNNDVIMTESPVDTMYFNISVNSINIELSLDETGYLTVKLPCSVSNQFYIGRDNAQQIFDYIQTKYNNTDVSDNAISDTSYTEVYNDEPVWDEELEEYIIFE